MLYKNWSKKQLRKQLRITKSKDNTLEQEILKDLLDNSVRPFSNNLTKEQAFNYDCQKIKEYSYFLEDIENLANMPIVKVNDPVSIHIPDNSKLTFVYDFFKYVTPNWLMHFNTVYKERKRNLRMGNFGNYSIYLNSLDYSYISILKQNLIDDLFNLVHEYTHTIVDRIFYRASYDCSYPFVELPPLNMELIASMFIAKTYKNLESDVVSYLIYLNNTIIDYAKKISAFSHKVNFGYAQYESLDDNKSMLEYLSYVIPFLYLPQLLELYLEEPDKWFYTLDKLITLKSNNYLEEGKKLGLTPNAKTYEFIKKLEEYNLN